MLKLVNNSKKLQDVLEPEISSVIKLEKNIKELETTTLNVLSK
jgi:hypothetical protein